MTTLARGGTSVSVPMVTNYESTRETGNRVHKIIGRPDPEVTLAEAGLRTGRLEVWCADHAQALAVEALHAGIGVLTLTDGDLPGLGMSYVTSGRVECRLDYQTQTRWLVTVEYAEVAP